MNIILLVNRTTVKMLADENLDDFLYSCYVSGVKPSSQVRCDCDTSSLRESLSDDSLYNNRTRPRL